MCRFLCLRKWRGFCRACRIDPSSAQAEHGLRYVWKQQTTQFASKWIMLCLPCPWHVTWQTMGLFIAHMNILTTAPHISFCLNTERLCWIDESEERYRKYMLGRCTDFTSFSQRCSLATSCHSLRIIAHTPPPPLLLIMHISIPCYEYIH